VLPPACCRAWRGCGRLQTRATFERLGVGPRDVVPSLLSSTLDGLVAAVTPGVLQRQPCWAGVGDGEAPSGASSGCFLCPACAVRSHPVWLQGFEEPPTKGVA
jgi:hypothetical protein